MRTQAVVLVAVASLALPLLAACECETTTPIRPDTFDSGIADGSQWTEDGQPPGTGDGSMTGRDAEFESCGTLTSTNAIPPTLMFQIDTSGSMNCPASNPGCTGPLDVTPDPNDSRYDVIRNALVEAWTMLDDTTQAGLMHYPNGFDSCAPAAPLVGVGPIATTRGPMGTALVGIAPLNGTPTHDAVMVAIEQLRTMPVANRFVILATDGAASFCRGCVDDRFTGCIAGDNEVMITDLAAAAAEGIRTFVIGVPGAQSFNNVLSRMATAGGTPVAGCSDAGPNFCHFDLTGATTDFAARLRAALAAISEATVSCTYDIPPDPSGSTFDPNRVNVKLMDGTTTTTIPKDETHVDGWDYNADRTQIIIHGAACDRAKAIEGGRITVQFGCPTVVM